MPCNCKVSPEEYPETAQWGPIVWRILHGLASHAGSQPNVLLQADERRTWIRLLNSVEKTLPCDVCRTHYAEWRSQHGTEHLMDLPYTEFGEWIRTDLWELHNVVNQGNEKPEYSKEQLGEYKQIQISPLWKALEPVMRSAMRAALRQQGVTMTSWSTWKGYVRTLQGMYGVL